jgi:hypothetical protein
MAARGSPLAADFFVLKNNAGRETGFAWNAAL